VSVQLWAMQLNRPLTTQEFERAICLLPPKRKTRLLGLRNEEKRSEPLCAYLLLRKALQERYGWQTLPEIAQADGGKPWFPEYPNVHFNLSHTDGAVLVGVADAPVGVDIEKIRPISQRMMRNFPDSETEELFFRLWVRREARTKRDGTGIGPMMRGEPPLRDGEVYRELDLFSGYVAGVAGSDRGMPQLQKYDMDELLRE